MWKIARAEHGLDNRTGIERVASLGCCHGKEAERIGIETVELPLFAEARDDGLGTCEAYTGVQIGQLGNQAAKASGTREMSAFSVGNPGFLCFSLTEES